MIITEVIMLLFFNCMVQGDVLTDQLYNEIVAGDYDSARTVSLTADETVVRDVVNRLLTNNISNIMEYGYKLWNYGGKEIVRNYFPIQFKAVLDGDNVKIVNKSDGSAIQLAMTADRFNDREALGGRDNSSYKVAWKLVSIWESNKVYFRILNVHSNQFLKLTVDANSAGDREAFGSNASNTEIDQWYLHPVKYGDDVLVCIHNRQNGQGLNLGEADDSTGDRRLWGHSGKIDENPQLYGWHIIPY